MLPESGGGTARPGLRGGNAEGGAGGSARRGKARQYLPLDAGRLQKGAG